jgi:hypothetical protein
MRGGGRGGLALPRLLDSVGVRETRRVSNDNLVHIDGVAWQLDQGFLAGKKVTILRSLLTPNVPPVVELHPAQSRIP